MPPLVGNIFSKCEIYSFVLSLCLLFSVSLAISLSFLLSPSLARALSLMIPRLCCCVFRGRCAEARRGVPTHACSNAPPDWKCKLDPAAAPFHQQLLKLYGESSKGVLNKMFYKEAYDQLRADPRLALPPEYKGGYPPRAKFTPGSPAPLIMWPHSKDSEEETFWPQNGTPRTAVLSPIFVGWFGLEWRNIWVYRAS